MIKTISKHLGFIAGIFTVPIIVFTILYWIFEFYQWVFSSLFTSWNYEGVILASMISVAASILATSFYVGEEILNF